MSGREPGTATSGPPARWQGAEYSQASGHHRAWDDWFLQRHPVAEADVVVDLGCGSGEFTGRLGELAPHGQVIGVDQDQSMLEHARHRAARNVSFVHAPAQQVDGVVEAGSVDLVVSRAMLHWLPFESYPQLFGAVLRVLRPGGWFHAEAGGAGNVPRLAALLDSLATEYGLPKTPGFPDTGLVFEALEAAGFQLPEEGIRTVAQRRHFTRDQAIGLLRTQGTLVITRHLPAGPAGGLVQAAVDRVDQLRRDDGSYDQTFVRLEILAQRPRVNNPAPACLHQ